MPHVATAIGTVAPARLGMSLVPVLGYETSTEIAKTALATGRGVYEIVSERGLMTRAEIDRILNPAAMTGSR